MGTIQPRRVSLRMTVLCAAVVGGAACGGGGATPDGGATDSGGGATDSALPWDGLTVDEPYTTAEISLVETMTVMGWRVELYVNATYTCGMSGFQTFTLVYPEGLPLTDERPLWVRMHGGGVGAFRPDGTYSPPEQINMIDEEGLAGLAGQLQETGLMTAVRNHPTGFRFLMPSLCDHDLYSGVGVPEPNNPFSPDENGNTRAADGLLATKAALAFTRERATTSHVFLHGTSAGSIGTFSVAYTLEREGVRLSGIIMDSHVMSDAFVEIIEAGCTSYEPDLVREKIGPMTDPENLPDAVVSREDITVPMLHIWSRGDPSCCGEMPMTFVDDDGVERTLGACDYHHERLRAAIEAAPPGGTSENRRLCVNSPGTPTPGACDMHSPTKIAWDEPTPSGDQDDAGADYNAAILDWVSARLLEPF